MSQIKYSLEDKLRILKPFMNDGGWYVSEKIRVLDPTNKIEFNVSAALSLLHKEGYLERKEAKRIFFITKHIKPGRRYRGLWAYRFKPELLVQNHKQLKLDYGNSRQKESRDCRTEA